MNLTKAVVEKSSRAILSANHRRRVALANLCAVLRLQGEVVKEARALNPPTGLL